MGAVRRVGLVGADRDGVRREQEPGVLLLVGRHGRARLVDQSGERRDEQRVVVEGADLRHRRGSEAGLAAGLLGPGDVLQVLRVPGVAAPGGGREDEGLGDAVARHLGDRVLDEGVPVPVTDVDRQVDAQRGDALGDERLQVGDDVPVLVGDGALAVHREVVLAHLGETPAGDAASAGHVLEERDDVLVLLGTPEGQDEKCAVGSL